jgi:hypothetical protein
MPNEARATEPHRRATQPRALSLLFIAVALMLALGMHGPIAQWADYHAFADTRGWLGLPNAGNVLSNLPFALIGAWGGWLCARSRPAGTLAPSTRAWACFSAALLCTGFGSALYHWAPNNAALVFDRLPIAWACAALLCAFLAERVDARWAGAGALGTSLAVASAAVGWWWFSEQHGAGDLRPYLFVQFLPMLLVPAALWLRLPARSPRALDDRTWWSVLGLYAAAKVMELADRSVFDALGFTSGHTLKHLLAASAALCLLRAVAAMLKSGSRR